MKPHVHTCIHGMKYSHLGTWDHEFTYIHTESHTHICAHRTAYSYMYKQEHVLAHVHVKYYAYA